VSECVCVCVCTTLYTNTLHLYLHSFTYIHIIYMYTHKLQETIQFMADTMLWDPAKRPNASYTYIPTHIHTAGSDTIHGRHHVVGPRQASQRECICSISVLPNRQGHACTWGCHRWVRIFVCTYICIYKWLILFNMYGMFICLRCGMHDTNGSFIQHVWNVYMSK
jgi:hypothetical protein